MLSGFESEELMRMQAEDNQVFEDIIKQIYSEVVHLGDNCLDGGASDGLHTIPLARLVGPEGSVFAVEPVPSVAQTLEDVLASKGIRNVRVIRQALYHESRTVAFKLVKNAPARSGIEKISYPFEPDFEEIDLTTVLIDDVLRDIASCRFCKLDLEGAEFRALQGGRSAIRRCSPFLVFERSVAATSWYRYTPSEFFGFFSDLDYQTFDLFGAELTAENWEVPGRPWYALGVRSASEDAAYVRERLPTILRELVEADRSPVEQSVPPPTGATGPFIWAEPNPVPGVSNEGTTVVHWDTGDGSIGEVYFSVNGDDERLFFTSAEGSRPAPWILARCTYDFRLYRGRDRAELLGMVTVRRSKR